MTKSDFGVKTVEKNKELLKFKVNPGAESVYVESQGWEGTGRVLYELRTSHPKIYLCGIWTILR